MLARVLVASLVLIGCASAPRSDVTVTTSQELIGALGRAGWTVRADRLLSPTGLFSTGAAYTAEQVPPGRRLLVFDTTEDGEPMPSGLVDSDVAQLRRLYAGRGVTVYRRPRVMVLTFGRGRNALDDRLESWLGRPVTAAPEGEREGS